jgi:hypothetical protein
MDNVPNATGPQCRLCGHAAGLTFVDLGSAPPCETMVTAQGLNQPETFYPLHVRICPSCLLVQLPECLPADEIFTDSYPYFSSFSTSWVEHARRFAGRAVRQLQLTEQSQVFEVASNDGYLLRHFRDLGIKVLGIEPTANTAAAARSAGIPTEVEFLGHRVGKDLAAKFGRAELVVANNVYAHVPDIIDFSRGLAELLTEDGWLTLEFPHIMRLIDDRQFDTIYHEHFQYYTLLTAQRALATADLAVVDVEELPTHGGSLRVWARHATAGQGQEPTSPAVEQLLEREAAAGLHALEGYAGFADAVSAVKRELLTFLLEAQASGKKVVGYGAPGKGNTMLNFCGVRPDLVSFTVDRNHHKHGRYLPGSHIPVLPPEAIDEARPDYIVVLPWNLRGEIEGQLAYTRQWGAKLVFAIPQLQIV